MRAAAAPSLRSGAGPKYVLEPLPARFQGPGYAAAIHHDGIVVGQFTTPERRCHACLWQKGRLTDLDRREGTWSGARGINRHGLIVGEFATGVGGPIHGFLWKEGRLLDLGTLGGPDSHALAINDAGLIAGYARDAEGITHAVVWEEGKIRVLAGHPPTLANSQALGMNQAGVIVGSAYGQSGGQAWVWGDRAVGPLVPPKGTRSSLAAAVNAAGDAAGQVILEGDPHPHACLWRQGTPYLLRTPGFSSTATALNHHGQVGGTAFHGKGEPRAFLAFGETVHDLTSLVQNAAGLVLRSVRTIDDRGWIVGEGERKGQVTAFLARPI